MSKIDLTPISSGYNLAKINENFDKIEAELQDKVLYRDNTSEEANHMEQPLDMNSNKIMNVATDLADSGSLITVGDADTRYLNSDGDILNGALNINGQVVYNVPYPEASNHASNKHYVDDEVAALRAHSDAEDASLRSHTDTNKLDKSGGTMTGTLDMGGKTLTNLPAPVAQTDAARLQDLIAQGVEGVLPQVQPIQTGDGSTTTFDVPDGTTNRASLFVYINGVYQGSDSYALNDVAFTITFPLAPEVGDIVEATRFEPAIYSAHVEDKAQVLVFDTVADYQAFSEELPVGKIVHLKDRGADFEVVAYNAGANGFNEIKNTAGTQSIALPKSNSPTSVRACGAKGDGTTDDTAAIRAALVFSLDVHFPRPDVAYRVTDSIQVHGGQKLTGHSKSDGESRDGGGNIYKKGIYGDMTIVGTPVFLLGDGVDPTKRLSSFYDLYIYCLNGPCIKSRFSTEYSFHNCTINSRFYHAIDTQQTYLCSWYNCKIGSSGNVGDDPGNGPSYAILAMDNSNGLLFSCCRITGGSAGGVADIGKSYTLTFDTCVFETSLWGIRVAGNPDENFSGNVHGFSMYNCQFENCGQALDLGSRFSLKAASIHNSYITHPQTGGMPFTEATIKIGRVIALSLTTMAVDLAPTQYVFNFHYDTEAANAGSLPHLKEGTIKGIEYFRIGSGFGYSYTGFVNDDQLSVLADNYMELPDFTTGIEHKVTTQRVDNTVGTLPAYLQLVDTKTFGYQIEKVELVEASGTINGRLVIGQAGNQAENMDYTLDGTGFVDGYLDITDQLSNIYTRTTTRNRVRWIAGAGTGTLSVRITYKG